jgi:hypothetical protein
VEEGNLSRKHSRGRALQLAVEPTILGLGHQHLHDVSRREAQQRVVGALRVGDQGADSPGAATAAGRALAERVGARALGAAGVERGCGAQSAGARGREVLPAVCPAALLLQPTPNASSRPGPRAALRVSGHSQADGVRGRDRRSGSSWDADLASAGSGP